MFLLEGTIIARNYFCIALINNQPNKSPVELFSGTVNLFFSLFNFMSIGYQNRISDRSMPQAYLCKSSQRHFPGLASIAEPNPQSMLILGIKLKVLSCCHVNGHIQSCCIILSSDLKALKIVGLQ